MQRLLLAASLAFAVAGGPARAQPTDLNNTTWYAINDACYVDSIDFYDDGTADISDFVDDDYDTARWSLEGDRLTVEYDSWYGGIEGTVFNGERIEATETWQDDESGALHHDPCIFEIDRSDDGSSPPDNRI